MSHRQGQPAGDETEVLLAEEFVFFRPAFIYGIGCNKGFQTVPGRRVAGGHAAG